MKRAPMSDIAVPMGECPMLHELAIEQLHRAHRAHLADLVWQQMSTVEVFEGHTKAEL
jgi:hypothetical protein